MPDIENKDVESSIQSNTFSPFLCSQRALYAEIVPTEDVGANCQQVRDGDGQEDERMN